MSGAWDYLTEREAHYMRALIGRLPSEPWAQSISAQISANGGITQATKALLFELRFGLALHQAGICPDYEIPGEGFSTLDFGFASNDVEWRVEMMRLEETQAAQSATKTISAESSGQMIAQRLSSDTADPRQSEEGETLKAVQRLCQKCERDGKPHKFPAPDGAYNVLLVDFRLFLHGGDVHDMVHIGLGGEFVSEEACRRYWDGKLISGAFDDKTSVRGADHMRERVHFIGFVNEQTYVDGAFASVSKFIANPKFFSNFDDARNVLNCWPLQPSDLLSVGW